MKAKELKGVHQSVTNAMSIVDFYCQLCNHKTKNSVKKDNIRIAMPSGMSWDDFQKNWEQSSPCSRVAKAKI